MAEPHSPRAVQIAGWVLAGASALLLAVPVWVWLQRGEGGWQLALAAAFLIASGTLLHGLIVLGVCVTTAWAERRYVLALTGVHLATAACAGIILTANRDFNLAAILTGLWAMAGIAAGLWLARRSVADRV